jgi:hypothetical protein
LGVAEAADVAQCGDSTTTVVVMRADVPPVIDGVLDDEVWSAASAVDRFCQVEPIEGARPSERTVFWLLYDPDNLYIAVRAYDREPQELIARQRQRDGSLRGDDRISIAIDTFHDRRNGYLFQINPNGSRRDGLIIESSDFRAEWDGIWFGASRIDDQGWTTEIALPMKTLNFDPKGDRWGFNILRAVRRRNETDRWTAANQNLAFINMAEIGTISGLRGLRQGLGLDVVPSTTLRVDDDRDESRTFTKNEPALDVFYNVTPSLTGVVTTNANFAEAAVDEVQVNLSRFSIFLPEQREFFLQDAGIFQFADLDGENGIPFFSRRIGIGPDGETVPIRIGGKLTGREGPWNVGLLSVRTGHEGDLDANYLSVGRVALNVLEESSLGAIATLGDPQTNDDNALVGTDFNYRKSDLWGDQVVEGSAWLQRSFSTGSSSDQAAWGATLAYPNDRINALLRYREFEENYNPAMGFANRVDTSLYETELRYRWRPESWLRTVDTGLKGRFVTKRAGRLESGTVTLRVVEFENQHGDQLDLAWTWREEDLEEPFRIRPGIVIPKSRYNFQGSRFVAETADYRKLSARLSMRWGTFFTGNLLRTEARLTWRPSAALLLVADWEQNDVDLDEGDFTTRVVTARMNISFNTHVFWDTFAQYDNESDEIAVNSQLRWLIEDGKELFLIFNPIFRTESDHLGWRSTRALVKVNWTFRY